MASLAPFPTPRTPKKYKHVPQPASPLEKYSRPLPPRLPSLRPWKEMCRNHFEPSSSSSRATSKPSAHTSTMASGKQRDRNFSIRFMNYSPQLYEFYYMSEDDDSGSDTSVSPATARYVRPLGGQRAGEVDECCKGSSVVPSLSSEFTRLMIPSTSQLRGPLASVSRSVAATRPSYTRSFASIVPHTPSTTVSAKITPSSPTNGQLRPQLNIPVDPNHGLYAFFRKREEDGAVKYDTIEPFSFNTASTGRSWTAAELRRKSFKDLHTLWYVLLRERNLLATQKEEGRRLEINVERLMVTVRAHRVRKSMARIKYVINERRLAYERALEIFAQKRAVALGEVEEQAVEPSKASAVTAPKARPRRSQSNPANDLFEAMEVSTESSEKRA